MAKAEGVELEGKKGSKKMLMILLILVLVILGVGGFIVFKFVLAPKDMTVQDGIDINVDAADTGTEVVADRRNAPTAAGVTISLESFVVNLTDPAGNRYLKLALAVNVPEDNPDLQAEIENRIPMIRDIVIASLSAKTYEEISTSQGKVFLKQELVRRINSVLSAGRLNDVYITEFVVQ